MADCLNSECGWNICAAQPSWKTRWNFASLENGEPTSIAQAMPSQGCADSGRIASRILAGEESCLRQSDHAVADRGAGRSRSAVLMQRNSRTWGRAGCVLSVSGTPLPLARNQRLRSLSRRQRPLESAARLVSTADCLNSECGWNICAAQVGDRGEIPLTILHEIGHAAANAGLPPAIIPDSQTNARWLPKSGSVLLVQCKFGNDR
jgi:hypothetical protein